MTIRTFKTSDSDAVISLWQRCSLITPQNNPWADIQRKVEDSPELFLVGELEGTIIATVMAGYEGHRGWINYLAVAPEHQKHGHGRRIMEEAEALLRQRGCPKINLQVRATNTQVIAFYESMGFSCDAAISMGKRLVQDPPL